MILRPDLVNETVEGVSINADNITATATGVGVDMRDASSEFYGTVIVGDNPGDDTALVVTWE